MIMHARTRIMGVMWPPSLWALIIDHKICINQWRQSHPGCRRGKKTYVPLKCIIAKSDIYYYSSNTHTRTYTCKTEDKSVRKSFKYFKTKKWHQQRINKRKIARFCVFAVSPSRDGVIYCVQQLRLRKCPIAGYRVIIVATILDAVPYCAGKTCPFVNGEAGSIQSRNTPVRFISPLTFVKKILTD